ncbi:MAG: hypothetical protein ACYDCL_00665 [Myxococcales bacterium]
MLRKTAPLALALAAAACSPPPSSYDAGCYPAPTSQPVSDAGSPSCTTWTGSCGDFGAAFRQQFESDGVCQSAADCALYGEPEGGYLFHYLCYETSFTPPINAAKRAELDQTLQGMICGYCQTCFPDGGLSLDNVNPPQDAGSCVEVDCVTGQCSQTSQ